jgi:hypothetical protein
MGFSVSGEPSHDDWLPLCSPPQKTMSKPDTKSGAAEVSRCKAPPDRTGQLFA